MTKNIYIISFSLLAFLLLSAWNLHKQKNAILTNANPPQIWDEQTPVADVLAGLGGKIVRHGVHKPTPKQIQQGKDLVEKGIATKKNGKKTARQSKHFVCTHCHNTQVEDPSLQISDVETRLTYAMDNSLPFLQGTTFYGTVNRKSWYNGDYVKKYGDLVKAANGSLREAIQLCAVECSQGRELKKWEVDAVVAYLWSLQLQMGDLGMTAEHWAKLAEVQNGDDTKAKKDAENWIRGRYLAASPATFEYSPQSRTNATQLKGNAKRGEAVYRLSCQHCHRPGASVTNFTLDNSPLTFKMLRRHLKKKTRYSIYEIARTGTKPLMGYRPYMPHYTLERMSNQQLADLAAYIEQEAR